MVVGGKRSAAIDEAGRKKLGDKNWMVSEAFHVEVSQKDCLYVARKSRNLEFFVIIVVFEYHHVEGGGRVEVFVFPAPLYRIT